MRRSSFTVVLYALIVAMVLYMPCSEMASLVNSMYRPYILDVADGDIGLIYIYQDVYKRRCMSFEEPVRPHYIQSCFDVHKPNRLIVPYIRMMMGALYINPRPRNILILGLGGGMLAKGLHSVLPDADIEILEISSSVVSLAKEYFGFRENNNITVHIVDAFRHVLRHGGDDKKYDLIFVDLIASDNLPPRLLEPEVLLSLRNLVSDNGGIAINCSRDNDENETLIDAMKRLFKTNYAIKNDGSVVLIGANTVHDDKVIANNADYLADSLGSVGIRHYWLRSKMTHPVK